VDVLADMIRCSSFREDDVAREKQVIEEEIGMYEDTPDELVHDLFAQTIWQGHPLGRPVLGTRETVNALSRQDILAHFAATCTPLDSVLAVAGSFDQQQVLALLEEGFGGWASAGARAANPPPRPEVATALRPKDTELVHVCLGGPGLPLEHAGIYPLNLMSNILGGGPSSRLFQEIREERGLAYSVFSYTSAFRDSGIFAIYCGAGKERIQTAMRVLGDELRRIGREGVGDVELSRAKEQLKSNLTMALESTAARMNRIGRSELLLQRVVPIDEVLDRIGRVTVDEIRRVADEFCDPERLSLAAIGPDLERLELRPALLGA
jgi:predicted Zn-dependent peptidase